MLHRDLRPANVLVLKHGPKWQVRIINFGLAPPGSWVEASSARPADERTLRGQSAARTARYAPPEMMGRPPGVQPGPYSDVYAFGKMCLYCLFKEAEWSDGLWKTLRRAGRAKWQNLLKKCVEQDWSSRFPSFEPIIEALDGIRRGRTRARKALDAAQQAAGRAEQRQVQTPKAQRGSDDPSDALASKARTSVKAEPERAVSPDALNRHIRQEAEIRLADFLMAAFDRGQGRMHAEDRKAVVDLYQQLSISQERAKQIANNVRDRWQLANRQPGEIHVNDIGMKFAWIPPGSFIMGSPPQEQGRGDDETQHSVTLTRGYYLGIYPVTQAEWRAVMGNNPSHFRGEHLPVETVSWHDAVAFCRQMGVRDDQPFRLPTEAEWERACRAGRGGPFFFGAALTTEQANFDGSGCEGPGHSSLYRRATTPVGLFPPNALGLHDMHGNVWEWCADWWGPYLNGKATDPQGGPEGRSCVLRGGSWSSRANNCRSAFRHSNTPDTHSNGIGFRVCFTPM